jgi:hypothetical protein
MKHLIFCLFFFSTLCLTAQTTNISKTNADTSNWKLGGVGGLNFNQTSFTNWAAGGENSLSGTAYSVLNANYKKGLSTWDNVLELAYGKTELGNARARKSDDKIDLSSKYGHYAFGKNWYYSTLFNFKSQFDKGYNYPNDSVVVSKFLAPGFFILSIGMDYKIKDYFSVMIGPLTGKLTVVNDQTLANEGAFGVDKAIYDTQGHMMTPGKIYLVEFGGYLKVAFKKEIMKNVTLGTKLELFSNYLKNPQNVVVNLETLLAFKVNKYITSAIITQLMYDDKINTTELNPDKTYKVNGPRVQFREVLAIGLSYKF